MQALIREDLLSLEKYAEVRSEFRAKVIAHKKPRKVAVGSNVTLMFEDRLTMQYQIQEILRAEKIFEAAGIEEELQVYNPLIPDGGNFKATMMIEYEDVAERQVALQKMKGIEDTVWVSVSGYDKVFAIADEDLERENEEKTAAVHFLRFELNDAMVSALCGGADLNAGIDHAAYHYSLEPISSESRDALVADLA